MGRLIPLVPESRPTASLRSMSRREPAPPVDRMEAAIAIGKNTTTESVAQAIASGGGENNKYERNRDGSQLPVGGLRK